MDNLMPLKPDLFEIQLNKRLKIIDAVCDALREGVSPAAGLSQARAELSNGDALERQADLAFVEQVETLVSNCTRWDALSHLRKLALR